MEEETTSQELRRLIQALRQSVQRLPVEERAQVQQLLAEADLMELELDLYSLTTTTTATV